MRQNSSVVQVAKFAIILPTTIDMHTFFLFLLSLLSLLYPFSLSFLISLSCFFHVLFLIFFFLASLFFLSFPLLWLLFVFIFFTFSAAITSYWLLPSLFSLLFPSTKSFTSQYLNLAYSSPCYILINSFLNTLETFNFTFNKTALSVIRTFPFSIFFLCYSLSQNYSQDVLFLFFFIISYMST